MSETNNTAPSGAAVGSLLPSVPQPPQPTPSAPTQPTQAPVGITSDQLRARLDETRETARKETLKSLGFEKLEDAATALKLAQDLQKSQMTEQERLQKELERLKPVETQYSTLKSQYDAYAAREFAALPEAAQKAIDLQAGGDSVKRMQLIELGRSAGWIGGQPAGPPIQPPAIAPVTTGPSAPAPTPVATSTAWDRYQSFLQTDRSGIQAKVFYQKNSAEIERTKPQGQ